MSCIRMKKYVILLLLTVLLLLVIMLMTSCGQKKAAGTNAGGEAASDLRGNYLETSIDLPDEMTYITDFKQLSDGSLCLMTFDEKDRDIVSWVSTDEGKNWIEKERYMKKIPLDISRPEIVEGYGYISDDGYVGIMVSTYNDKNTMEGENYCFIIDAQGIVKEVDSNLDSGSIIYEMYFTDNAVYFCDLLGSLYRADKDTRKVNEKCFDKLDLLLGVLDVKDNILYGVGNKKVEIIGMKGTQRDKPEDVLNKLSKHIDSNNSPYRALAAETRGKSHGKNNP